MQEALPGGAFFLVHKNAIKAEKMPKSPYWAFFKRPFLVIKYANGIFLPNGAFFDQKWAFFLGGGPGNSDQCCQLAFFKGSWH